MEIFALTLIFFLSFFFVLIFRLVDNLRLWESKEYRFERILSHVYWDINYTPRSFVLTSAKFIIYAVILTFTLSLAPSSIAIITIYTIWIIEVFNYLNKIFYNRSLGINLSVRNMTIIGVYAIFLTSLFFVIALAFSIIPHSESEYINLSEYVTSTQNIDVYPDAFILLVILSVIGLTLDLSTPLIAGFLVFITSPIGRLNKLFNLFRLQRNLKSLADVRIIGITGSFGKSTLIKYIDDVLEGDDRVLLINKDYTSVSSLAHDINVGIKHTTKLIIFEFEGYTKGELKQIIKTLKPDVIALTDVGYNHVTGFKSHETFLESFKEMQSHESIVVTNNSNEYNKKIAESIKNKVIDIELNESKKSFEFNEVKIKAANIESQKYKKFALEIFAALNLINPELIAKISETPVRINQFEEIEGDKDSNIIIDNLEDSDVNGLIHLVSTPPSNGNETLKILITDGFNELGKLKKEVVKKSLLELSKHIDALITTDYAIHKVALENNIVSHYFTGIDKLLVFTRSILNKNLTIYIEGDLKEPLVKSLRKQD